MYMLNNNINNERKIANELGKNVQGLENSMRESLDAINMLNDEINQLRGRNVILEEDNEHMKQLVSDLRDNNSELIDKIYDINGKAKEDQAKTRDALDKFKDDMETNMDNLNEKVTNKKNEHSAK